MSNPFVPLTKNPPAKVKDPGIVSLVLAGAGAYNAKNRDLLLLPEGRATLLGLTEKLVASLREDASFQPVDCAGSDSAVYSLAERYVREYREQALLWSQTNGRALSLHAWQPDCDTAAATGERALQALQDTLGSALTEDVFAIAKVVPGRCHSWTLACGAAKGAEDAIAGFRCRMCGEVFLPDAVYASAEAPVNAGADEQPVQDVHTPGTHTIQLLCEYLHIPIETTLKAMLYTMELPGGEKKLLFAMIRGDRDISVPKLAAWIEKNYSGAMFRRAEAAEIVAAFGEVAGFCGPLGVPNNVQMIADFSLKDGKNFVVGGNRPDYHKTGCSWGRDFAPPLTDLALFGEGLPCPKCGNALAETWLRQLGEIDSYGAAAAGEPVLSCRDRDGAYEWPCRLYGTVSLTAVLLALFEKRMNDVPR